jgi:hypothetical protein
LQQRVRAGDALPVANPSDPAAGFWLNLAGIVLPTLFAIGTAAYSIWRRGGRGKRLA